MQDKTSILAATTPQDNTTYHAFLINVLDPDTNERIFNVVNLIEVCKACKKTDKPWKCTHMADRISGSKSQASRDQTLLFYRDGQQAVALRELFGEQSKNTSGLLPEPWIERFLKSEIHIKDPVRALYLAVDPGGGGPGELGIVGIVETLSVEYGARLAVRRSVCMCCSVVEPLSCAAYQRDRGDILEARLGRGKHTLQKPRFSQTV